MPRKDHALPVLYAESRDRDESSRLTAMVLIAQVFGLGLIAAALWLLGEMPQEDKWKAYKLVLVGCSLIPLFMIPWTDSFLNLVDRAITGATEAQKLFSTKPESKRRTLLTWFVLGLVLADSAILTTLIVWTCGIGRTPLDPLLAVIPIIAIVLKQPKRTVLIAVIAQATAILGPLLHHYLHDAVWFPDLFKFADSMRKFKAHDDAHFIHAFAVVAIGSIGLSWLEYSITHGRSQLGLSLRSSFAAMKEHVELPWLYRRSIKAGLKKWYRWLDSQSLEKEDHSLVHDRETIGQQAIILALPYWKSEAQKTASRLRITRRIAFLTYAAHWIDDHFDPTKDCPRSPKLKDLIRNATPFKIIQEDPRLQALLRAMQKRTTRNRQKFVERAVLRIIYGGLIQNAETDDRLRRLFADYVKLVSDDLCSEIRDEYTKLQASPHPMIVWITTKVVLELLDACGEEFSLDRSEFFNLLYGPILHYQDNAEEIIREGFGSGLGADVRQSLPTNSELVSLATDCIGLTPKVFGGATILPESRRLQLECLLKAFGGTLPDEVRQAYSPFLVNSSPLTPTPAQVASAQIAPIVSEALEPHRTSHGEPEDGQRPPTANAPN